MTPSRGGGARGALGARCLLLLLGVRTAEAASLLARSGLHARSGSPGPAALKGPAATGYSWAAWPPADGPELLASAEPLPGLAGSSSAIDGVPQAANAGLPAEPSASSRSPGWLGLNVSSPALAAELVAAGSLAGLNASLAGAEGLVEASAGLAGLNASLNGSGEPGYAFQDYLTGETLECRGRDGRWAPVVVVGRKDQAFDVHVADEFPGYDLPSVPAAMLRRRLWLGQADFLVDNGRLKARGLGLKYRHSKDVQDTSADYAPWGTLVMGEDEEDGWVRTSRGYLPLVFRDAQVLVKTEREKEQNWSPEDAAAERPSQEQVFDLAESCEFHTNAGQWHPCRVTGSGWHPYTYHVVVERGDEGVSPMANVPARSLRRVTAPKAGPRVFPAPNCRRDGCLVLQVKTEGGRLFMLQISKKDRLGSMMEMVCSKLDIDWESCTAQHTFRLNGELLHPWTNATRANLTKHALVFMWDAPPGSK